MQNIKAVFAFAAQYLKPYWGRVVLGFIFGIMFALANASFLWAIGTLTERLEEPAPFTRAAAEKKEAEKKAKEKRPEKLRTPTFMTAWRDKVRATAKEINYRSKEWIEPRLPRIDRPLDRQQVIGMLLFLPILVSIRGIADYMNNYFMGSVGERVVNDVRVDILKRLSILSLDYFNKTTSGDLLTRINTDSMNLLRALRNGGADLIKEPLTILTIFISLLIIEWKLTLAAVIFMPLCIFPLIVLGKKARDASRKGRKAGIRQASQLIEFLSAVRVVKAFRLENDQLERFRENSRKIVKQGVKGVKARELVNPILEVIAITGLGALLVFLFKWNKSSDDLIQFLAGLIFLLVPLKKLASIHILFEQASVGTNRLIEILNEQPTVREPTQPKKFDSFQKEIRFEGVHFAYNSRPVLQDLSVTIPRGFKLGIAGESGSGKSTLINLLLRFYDPTSGRITMDGIDLRDLSFDDLRRPMALVSQEIVIFDQTVAENIACGKLGASREEVIEAAKAAQAHGFIMQLDQQYDTRLGERGVTLSGGQRQRIAIARAFVRNAPILILDEATASLDSQSEAEVQSAIDKLAEHRTVICVAHRLSTLKDMDAIMVVSEGRMIEQGSFAELLAKNGAFAAMAARQGMLRRSRAGGAGLEFPL